jgi:hypothetical protein
LIVAAVSLSVSNSVVGNSANIRISGGNSTSFVGGAAGSRVQAAGWVRGESQWDIGQGITMYTLSYLDSPATTSATTYEIQARIGNAGTAYINRSGSDTDNATFARTPSSITVMEISA